jgi:hypothetical protein
MSKYIQSFWQYPVTFSSIAKTIPARGAQGEMRNIAEITDREYEILQNREPYFRELVDQKKFRVLNRLPESYIPPAQRINEAQDKAERLAKENEELKARLAAKEAGEKAEDAEEAAPGKEAEKKDYDGMSYKQLQAAAKEKGINPSQGKAALLAALKEADEE